LPLRFFLDMFAAKTFAEHHESPNGKSIQNKITKFQL